MTLDDSSGAEYVGDFSRMLNCSQAVLDSYPDAWAAIMTNPYQVDELTIQPGPYQCMAVVGTIANAELPFGENPQQMLCLLKGGSLADFFIVIGTAYSVGGFFTKEVSCFSFIGFS